MTEPVQNTPEGVARAPVRGHIVELDSLRGLAAGSVILDHFARFWREDSPPHWVMWTAHAPLSYLGNGHAAVIMFFVLSGFVLTLPMLSGRRQLYRVYIARRICRIYLPYVAALCVALIACSLFHGRSIYGAEYQLTWRSGPQWNLVLQHLAFIDRFDVFAYNPPIWSLVHEMRVSLVFPFLCIPVLYLRTWITAGLFLLFPLVTFGLDRAFGLEAVPSGSAESWLSWSLSLSYCGVFVLGSALARHHETIRAHFGAIPKTIKIVGLVVAFVLYEHPRYLHIPGVFHDSAIAVGAGYVLVLALLEGGWISRFLRRKPLRFLGKISYSLYLIHMPILMLLSAAIYRKMPYGYLLVPYLAITVALAAAFYHLVEESSIRLGRAIGSKLISGNLRR